jgi:hypothetical protein
MADDVASLLSDSEAIAALIVANSNFVEMFVGFTGVEELAAPTVAEGDDSADDAGSEEWWAWWNHFGLSDWVGIGISGGVAVGTLGLFTAGVTLVRRRRNSSKEGRKGSVFEMGNPMGRGYNYGNDVI